VIRLAGGTVMTEDPIVIRQDIRRYLVMLKIEMDSRKRSNIKRRLTEAQWELVRATAKVEPSTCD
jgi:hypothetical protein